MSCHISGSLLAEGFLSPVPSLCVWVWGTRPRGAQDSAEFGCLGGMGGSPTPVTSLLSSPASSGLHGEAGCPRLRSIPREHQQPPLRGGGVRDPLRTPQPLLPAARAGLLLQQGPRVPGAGPQALYAGLPRGL